MKKIVLTLVLLVITTIVTVAQCAMCRATVSSNLSEGRGVIGTGLNFGILYLLLMPYILVSVMVFIYFRVGKKELAKKLSLKKRIDEIYG